MSMKILKTAILVGGAFVLGLLAGLLGAMIATDPGDNLTLEEFEFITAPTGDRLLTGVIRNNTDQTYAFVQVDILLLDEEGTPLGRTFTTASNLILFDVEF